MRSGTLPQPCSKTNCSAQDLFHPLTAHPAVVPAPRPVDYLQSQPSVSIRWPRHTCVSHSTILHSHRSSNQLSVLSPKQQDLDLLAAPSLPSWLPHASSQASRGHNLVLQSHYPPAHSCTDASHFGSPTAGSAQRALLVLLKTQFFLIKAAVEHHRPPLGCHEPIGLPPLCLCIQNRHLLLSSPTLPSKWVRHRPRQASIEELGLFCLGKLLSPGLPPHPLQVPQICFLSQQAGCN